MTTVREREYQTTSPASYERCLRVLPVDVGNSVEACIAVRTARGDDRAVRT